MEAPATGAVMQVRHPAQRLPHFHHENPALVRPIPILETTIPAQYATELKMVVNPQTRKYPLVPQQQRRPDLHPSQTIPQAHPT